MRSADIVCDDGSSMLLSGVFYIPKLGINLLHGRKLCEDGFKGEFDARHMYFKFRDSNQKVIPATMKNGLYFVTNIANDMLKNSNNVDLALASIQLDPCIDAESVEIRLGSKKGIYHDIEGSLMLEKRRFARYIVSVP